MTNHIIDTVKFSVPERSFWNRSKQTTSWVILVAIIFTSIVLTTSNNPIQDSLIIFFLTILFGFVFNLTRFIRDINLIIFDLDNMTIEGKVFNKPFIEKTPYKDLRLSVEKLRRQETFTHVGYKLNIKNNKGKSYVIRDGKFWTALAIRDILKEIKFRREQKKIHRDDGTYFISEIEGYIKKRSL